MTIKRIIKFKDYNNLTFIILAVLVIFLLYVISQNRAQISFLNNKNDKLNNTVDYLYNKNVHLNNTNKWFQHRYYFKLNSNMELENEKGSKMLLSQLSEQKQKLVFKFSYLNCNVCVDSGLVYIKKFAMKYGQNSVLVISSRGTPRTTAHLKSNFKIENIFNSEDSSFEKLDFPYFFILDRNFHAKNIFIPNKYFPELTNEYIETIDSLFHKFY